jgi:hypothetical protein
MLSHAGHDRACNLHLMLLRLRCCACALKTCVIKRQSSALLPHAMTVPTPPPPPGVWRATTEAVTGAHQHSIVGCAAPAWLESLCACLTAFALRLLHRSFSHARHWPPGARVSSAPFDVGGACFSRIGASCASQRLSRRCGPIPRLLPLLR